MTKRKPRSILVISDQHFPYQHPDIVDFLRDTSKEYRTDLVINSGDELDAYFWSKYVKSPESEGGPVELDRAIRGLKNLYKLFPKVHVCNSNHTQRPYKRAMEAGLTDRFLKPINQVLEAPPGWVWRDSWVFNDTLFIHGEGYSGAQGALQAAMKNRMNTVIGHLHSYGGVVWQSGDRDSIFGMNVGCLIDVKAAAFSYAKTLANKPTIGCGVIVDGLPIFVKMK